MSYSIATASIFIWIGFVGAISFMEAWLKFRAPGVTLSIGLSIGLLVFKALNIVEWTLLGVAAISMYPFEGISLWLISSLVILTIILLLQTAWLIPYLTKRVGLYVSNQPVPPSKNHLAYIALECVKMVFLAAAGIKLLSILKRF
jgi:hypothetical protein